MKRYPYRINGFDVFYGDLTDRNDCNAMSNDNSFEVSIYNKLDDKQFLYLKRSNLSLLLISKQEYSQLNS